MADILITVATADGYVFTRAFPRDAVTREVFEGGIGIKYSSPEAEVRLMYDDKTNGLYAVMTSEVVFDPIAELTRTDTFTHPANDVFYVDIDGKHVRIDHPPRPLLADEEEEGEQEMDVVIGDDDEEEEVGDHWKRARTG